MERLSTFDVADPSRDALERAYAPIIAAVEQADSPEDLLTAVSRWDEQRCVNGTWRSLVGVRFAQDTRDVRAKERRSLADELSAFMQGKDATIQRLLLAHRHADTLRETFGDQACALWESEASAFDASIEADLVAEAKLSSRYSELRSNASIVWRGEEQNLSQLYGLREHPDADARKEGLGAFWGWHEAHADEIDAIFDELVRLRDGMAKRLGMRDFVELGYRRMQRIGYNREDVARLRQQVLDHVVPLCARIRAQQAERYGHDHVAYVDEAVLFPEREPRPGGTTAQKTVAAQEMFDAMDPALGSFFRTMVDKELLDLEARSGKQPGGFCTDFPTEGVPFIFANFDGSKSDVRVFTHEAGHAYQMWSSREQPLVDYRMATYESCEIHSMSLEFLTWPHMELFFGDEADQFRRVHLADALLFLPYGCAIDAFQHWVYENPAASPAERREAWSRLERSFLPWRRNEGLPLLEAGGFWHRQAHVFQAPFYYIDYVLAGICALQFWRASDEAPAEALAPYRALCELGGSRAFGELASFAGLRSPFESGCLTEVAAHAAAYLGLDGFDA